MKRVLRSCFEPLPRFLSTKGLLLVVGMLICGTGLSVYEYLESTRPAGRHERALRQAPAMEVRAADRTPARAPEALRGPARAADPVPACVAPSVQAARSCDALCEPGPAARARPERITSPPSVWEPEERSGS